MIQRGGWADDSSNLLNTLFGSLMPGMVKRTHQHEEAVATYIRLVDFACSMICDGGPSARMNS
jgi:hypothetical protein